MVWLLEVVCVRKGEPTLRERGPSRSHCPVLALGYAVYMGCFQKEPFLTAFAKPPSLCQISFPSLTLAP